MTQAFSIGWGVVKYSPVDRNREPAPPPKDTDWSKYYPNTDHHMCKGCGRITNTNYYDIQNADYCTRSCQEGGPAQDEEGRIPVNETFNYNLMGFNVVATHEGFKPLHEHNDGQGAQHILIESIVKDLHEGKTSGFMPYNNFECAIKWEATPAGGMNDETTI